MYQTISSYPDRNKKTQAAASGRYREDSLSARVIKIAVQEYSAA
jgi:hypothetical protein